MRFRPRTPPPARPRTARLLPPRPAQRCSSALFRPMLHSGLIIPYTEQTKATGAPIGPSAQPDISRQRAMVKALTGNQTCVTTAEPARRALE
ncbi:protein of unknown function [Hyphomicrobium sp. MC1]|nr:protein of unknown function [Hyphomicrobium sp. MC1]